MAPFGRSEADTVLDPDDDSEATRVRVVDADVQERRRAVAGRGVLRSDDRPFDSGGTANVLPGVQPAHRAATGRSGARGTVFVPAPAIATPPDMSTTTSAVKIPLMKMTPLSRNKCGRPDSRGRPGSSTLRWGRSGRRQVQQDPARDQPCVGCVQSVSSAMRHRLSASAEAASASHRLTATSFTLTAVLVSGPAGFSW